MSNQFVPNVNSSSFPPGYISGGTTPEYRSDSVSSSTSIGSYFSNKSEKKKTFSSDSQLNAFVPNQNVQGRNLQFHNPFHESGKLILNDTSSYFNSRGGSPDSQVTEFEYDFQNVPLDQVHSSCIYNGEMDIQDSEELLDKQIVTMSKLPINQSRSDSVLSTISCLSDSSEKSERKRCLESVSYGEEFFSAETTSEPSNKHPKIQFGSGSFSAFSSNFPIISNVTNPIQNRQIIPFSQAEDIEDEEICEIFENGLILDD